MNALSIDAESIAAACRAMARRFAQGGRLVVFGNGGSVSDVAHVVVEFVHPVIVGKRALPAFAVPSAQLALFAEPTDIALAIAEETPSEEMVSALTEARRAGLLTVALVGEHGASTCPAEHVLSVRSTDPLVVSEAQVTVYHVLWELVHVFLERPGAGARR